MLGFPFREKDLSQAHKLMQERRVKNILFSEGTYQVEIEDKEEFWPFLQIDDGGRILDLFCTCSEAEGEKNCSHLAAAYLSIMKEEPLHVRYRRSFWHHLCQIAFKRHGSDPKIFKKKEEGIFQILSQKGREILILEGRTKEGRELLQEVVFKHPLETEETSLKFSNLPPEELLLWRKGTPSSAFAYELSFWSDLAKWMLCQEELGQAENITFQEKKDSLPESVTVTFPSFIIKLLLFEMNFPELIPSLKEVSSSLPVHEFRLLEMEKITYEKEKQEFHLSSYPHPLPQGKGIRVGEWEYLPREGFFPLKIDPLLEKQVIGKEEIGEFLERHYKLVESYGKEIFLSLKEESLSYQLFFDQKRSFHIAAYLFEKGDLQKGTSALFGNFAYLDFHGFYRIGEKVFDQVEKTIPFAEIGDFIAENRSFLNRFEEYSIHPSNLEFRLIYRLDEKESLLFENERQVFEEGEEILDFGDWIYLKGKGFYKKLKWRPGAKIKAGHEVKKGEISSFIRANQEELEQIKNFFSEVCPIEKGGVEITLDQKGTILVHPEFLYRPRYQKKQVRFFGDFVFVQGEGFSEISPSAVIPKGYQEATFIPQEERDYFISIELPKLAPYILKIDKRLQKPRGLRLQMKKMEKNAGDRGRKWLVELSYQSEQGELSLITLKQALDKGKSYLLSEAGLIFLKDPRFRWLREFSTEKMKEGGSILSFSTLDYIRLGLYEKIEEPRGEDESAFQSRKLLRQLESFETEEELDLNGLKSVLRPYQQVGVKWLFFLYCYGLSGLLCDEMGLGKTHQAMALIAAVYNLRKEGRAPFLVVCPTSVLYHWEDLLKRFFPAVSVRVFYGAERSLEPVDLILTSYGILRSEKEMFAPLLFEIAIFDELQIAKNAHSQTHQSLLRIKAKSKIGLTGTPIENHLIELKALFDLLLPHYFPPQTQFRDFFVTPIEKYQDKEKKELLSRFIHPFLMRRKKSEVLDDLPEKIEEIAYCFLSEEQQKLYKEHFLESREKLLKKMGEEKKEAPYLHIFTLLSTLKQICNHPCLVTKDLKNFHKHKSGKWDLFVELLNEVQESGQKLVIFTQFLDMMTIIESYLKEKRIGFAAIRGSTRDRKGEIKRFQEDPHTTVFVASLKAAGTGIDLTSASVVIHYDRWWNPAKENQATDRVHRIGQNRGVQVFKMVTKHTIEEHIHELIQRKVGLLEGVVGYDDQDQIKRLKKEDLLYLLEEMNRDLV